MTAPAAQWLEDRRFYWLLTLMLAAAVAFTVFPSGFDWPAEEASAVEADDVSGEVGAGSLARKLQWMPLFAIAGIVLFYRARLAALVALRSNPFLWLFLLWCAASVLWSPYPSATLKKVIQYAGVLAIALSFQCASWQPARFENVTRTTASWIILLSVPFTLLFPDIGIHHGGDTDGKWKGLTTNKNSLGLIAAFAMIFWLHAWLRGAERLRRAAPWMLLSFVIMVLAQSGTAFGVAVICGSYILFMMRPPFDYRGLVLPAALVGITTVLMLWLVMTMIVGSPGFADVFGPIAGLFGKDLSLTGRTDIWALTLEEASRHPLHGIGYGAFWLGPDSRAGWIIDILYWVPWQGHNAYIDIYNETGLVGLALVVLFLIYHALQLRRLARIDRASYTLHAAIFIYVVLTNVVETGMFRPINLSMVLMFVSSMDVSRQLFDLELRYARPGGALAAPSNRQRVLS